MGIRHKQGSGEVAEATDAKQRLLASALTLFSEKGYDGASIREIIEAAGVTRPVLYYYFENKEDLFCRLIEGEFEGVLAAFDAVLSNVSGCRNRLKALMWGVFERTERAPEVVRLLLQVFFSPPKEGPQLDKDRFARERTGRIVRIMREGLESGELAGADAETLALAFGGLMDMHVMAKCHQPEARLTRELGEGLVDLFLDGASSIYDKTDVLVSPFTI